MLPPSSPGAAGISHISCDPCRAARDDVLGLPSTHGSSSLQACLVYLCCFTSAADPSLHELALWHARHAPQDIQPLHLAAPRQHAHICKPGLVTGGMLQAHGGAALWCQLLTVPGRPVQLRPGSQPQQSWSLIVPAGWVAPIWLALVHAGDSFFWAWRILAGPGTHAPLGWATCQPCVSCRSTAASHTLANFY